MSDKTKIGLVDDHQLFLKSLSLMIESFSDYEVVVEAINGEDLKQKLETGNRLPELMLVDVNMPVMGGEETAKWLAARYPDMLLVALSMNDKDPAVLGMMQAGCCAYLLKETHPNELEKALFEIRTKGYYLGDACNLSFRRIWSGHSQKPGIVLTPRELQFLKAACSDLTYKQIASDLNVSERTVDGYREALFEKFNVQSRVGLCLEAIRKGYIML